MIFAINKLKYDTEKMELVSTKCKIFRPTIVLNAVYDTSRMNPMLFKSEKGNWLLTYITPYKSETCAMALTPEEAARYLLRYDLEAYEKYFGELEDA